ncbi:MAG: glutamate 5-kinase [Thermaerobacter sp.]|nr:glutamate 5-kinase [Thermaerobacter sp.]
MRWVVKVGTSSVCEEDGRLSHSRIKGLAEQVGRLYHRGHEVMMVSSGAVGAGVGRIGRWPQTVGDKQALAAIGQARLIQAYQSVFDPVPVGQILITRADLEDPARRMASGRTLQQLLEWGVVPIINENDTVADEELRIGDNDTLAARVATLVDADLLVILSDIDGLYTDNPRLYPDARRIATVPWVTAEDLAEHTASPGPWGTGGMATKLEAARISQEAGIGMVLASSHEPDVLAKVMGMDWPGGTRFLAQRGNFGA